MKRIKNVRIENREDGNITLQFNAMFVVKAVRRELPPPTKIEKPKKGKGSYSRKDKHKGRGCDDSCGTCFIF